MSVKPLIAALLLSNALPASHALAQGMRGPGGGGPRMRPGERYMQLFDPKTVQTVQGEVTELRRVPHPQTQMTGVHALLKSSSGDLTVHLGPSWFIDNQELQLAKGDKVTVTGSSVTVEGTPTLIATEVKRADATLTLRSADGVPLWVAWRRPGGK